MARFTQEQLDEAVAEFFSDEDLSIEWGLRPAVGLNLNGPITVYNKVESNGNDETASE